MSQQGDTAKVYQLKISIVDARPPLWRRVQVPGSSTLADLHRVIQALMGWRDNHLHEFEVPATGENGLLNRRAWQDIRRFGPTADPSGQPFHSPEYVLDWLSEEELTEDEAHAVLQEVAPCEKARFLYIYDMGDSWEHDILVEKILPADPRVRYSVCLTGKRNGPVEDCGGIAGYEELLEVLADPKHAEHRRTTAWLKQTYGVSTWDDTLFDEKAVNQRLKQIC